MADELRQALAELFVPTRLVYDSMMLNPRHLELCSYPFWNVALSELLARQGITTCATAPQYPIYISDYDNQLQPDTASTATKTDSTAKGFALDFATLLPCPRPRVFDTDTPDDFRDLLELSVQNLLSQTTHKVLSHSQFHRLFDLELKLLVITEVKKPPTRHPDDIDSFCADLRRLLGSARKQAQEQANCLFSCCRFAAQDEVILKACSGDFYNVMFATHGWSVTQFEAKETFTYARMRDAKGDSDDEGGGLDPKHGDADVRDSEFEMSNPALARANIAAKLAKEQEKRRERGVQRRQATASSTMRKSRPASKDRRPFTNEELHSHKVTGVDFMETREPSEVLAVPGTWTRVLRMGSPLSDKYQEYIAAWIKKYSDEELQARETAFFGDD